MYFILLVRIVVRKFSCNYYITLTEESFLLGRLVLCSAVDRLFIVMKTSNRCLPNGITLTGPLASFLPFYT